MSFTNFRKLVWVHYKEHGRHDLPWRQTQNPYRILVSEIMLQQTQVERVIPLYRRFIKKFPTARKLSQAPLSCVLQMWQGLGYNRRAKMLYEAAREVAKRGMPRGTKELEALPGVGPYTARAVAAFAYNDDVIFLETNIRTAVIHHFFKQKKKVSDGQIAEILGKVAPRGKSSDWYSALMDYGASLKRAGVRNNARHAAYVKQRPFTGSLREARGTILRTLAKHSTERDTLIRLLGEDRMAQMTQALSVLQKEGLVQKKGNRYFLAE